MSFTGNRVRNSRGEIPTAAITSAKEEQFLAHHKRNSVIYQDRFNDYNFSVRNFPDEDTSSIAFEIFCQLDLMKDFNIRRSTLVRFIISIQEGYRPLPYHNWHHAVSVCHFTYLLLTKLKLVELGHLTKLEAFSLVVSALVHDIDHRGTNNEYQIYSNSDIYNLYAGEGSFMERHHLSLALTILGREECNILESLDPTEYKYFTELLTWNIIATDVTKHLSTKKRLFKNAKSRNKQERKFAKLSLFMTAADLSDNCKKWNDNLPVVKGVLSEYFLQGDAERKLGRTPITMLDRSGAYVPFVEYKFIKRVVAPIYVFLSGIYEDLIPCKENIANNKRLWALATYVFDEFKDNPNQLDVLDLPAMREEELLNIRTDLTFKEIVKRRFSLAIGDDASVNNSDDDEDEEGSRFRLSSMLCCCSNLVNKK